MCDPSAPGGARLPMRGWLPGPEGSKLAFHAPRHEAGRHAGAPTRIAMGASLVRLFALHFIGRAAARVAQLGEFPMQEYRLYIDGKFCDAEGGKTAESTNPATEQSWAKVARAGR